MSNDRFTSRWGMMLAMLGMAVGTGNIWRFPRIAATNGGGSFLVAWVVFLLLWSVPLIMVEFAMGKATRFGAVGAFGRLIGPRASWMGAWVAWTATAIMFYYAVVMGWTLRYFIASFAGELVGREPGTFWASFAYTPTAVLMHLIAVGLGVWVVARGVRGIETAARVLIPTLFVLVIVLVARAVTLPGASAGLNYLFGFHLADLGHPGIWIAALTQNAWDTGAGWGLILTYAVYMRKREDTTLNSFLLGFGNNSVSLLAGIMVLCTIFAVLPQRAADIVGADNEGLTFIWVPQLFARMPGGRVFMTFFFLALMFAAWTSLISMIELATRVLADAGLRRGRALAIVGGAGFLLGIPSALSHDVFLNQDFVWSVGLMVSGLFFAVAVLRFGATRFRERFMNTPDADLRIGRWWDWAIRFVVVEAVVLIVWWFAQVRGERAFGVYGIGNMVVQWGIALLVFLLLNRWMARRTLAGVEGLEETAAADGESGERSPPEGHMPPSIP